MARASAAGRYTVIEELGEGGFARVFKARDEITHRVVALKVLKESYVQHEQVLERFRREVFAVASISSPHVVEMYDFGMSNDEFFIAMEYVEGPTLRDIVKETQWTGEGARLLVGQVAQALSVAHGKNILHRDLKPENVMVLRSAAETHAKVLDFGFAKLAEFEREMGAAPVTRIGSSFGTPHYMSPEQIRGKPADPSVDLYALGVMAYEMLAGRRPFGGNDPYEVMRNVLSSALPPIDTIHSSLVPRLADLNRFFAAALAKDKGERPTSAVEFFQRFDMALFGDRAASLASSDPEQVFSMVTARGAASHDGFENDTVQMGAPVDIISAIAAATAATAAASRTGERMHSGWFDTKDVDALQIATSPEMQAVDASGVPLAAPDQRTAPSPAPADAPEPIGSRTMREPMRFDAGGTSTVNPLPPVKRSGAVVPLLVFALVVVGGLAIVLGVMLSRHG